MFTPRSRIGMRRACQAAMVGGMMLGVAAITACVGDNRVAPTLRPEDSTLGKIQISPLNAIMAVGDTLSLTVTGRTLSGAPIASFDSVMYLLQNVTDSIRLRVSSSGVVTALAPSGYNGAMPIQVMAFKDGLVRAEVAFVQVTATSFAGATLSIQPSSPEDAQIVVGHDRSLVPVIRNPTTGEYVDGPLIRYEYGAGDSTTMQCYSPSFVPVGSITLQQLKTSSCGTANMGLNQIHGNIKGTAWVVANVTVYGVPLRDSVQYTVTNSTEQYVIINAVSMGLQGPSFNSFVIAPGGIIYFNNNFSPEFGASITWTFDDPSAASATDPPSDQGGASGNITAVPPYGYSARQFMTAGSYTWTATVIGGVPPFTGATVQGTVIVQ